MIMITGGAYQGKIEFAEKLLSADRSSFVNGSECEFDEIFGAICVNEYHLLVRRLIAENHDPLGFTEEFCRRSPDTAVIINEIGAGIIPLEKSDRQWRENAGRCGRIIAEHSDKVYRICCGIPMLIKGE